MAPWLVVLPPIYAGDPTNDFANNPVGTGPYRFVRWHRGSRIVLERNADYFGETAKGEPVAARVDFRFVPDATTRVTDVVSGTSQLVRAVPYDELETVAAAAEWWSSRSPGARSCASRPMSRRSTTRWCGWRSTTRSTSRRSSPACWGATASGCRIFSFRGGLGYDEDLAPHPYDPELAQQLLAEAGYPDGFSTRLAYTTGERAIWRRRSPGSSGPPASTSSWSRSRRRRSTPPGRTRRPLAAALDMAPAVRPVHIAQSRHLQHGFLSRYDNPEAQTLIEAGRSSPIPKSETASIASWVWCSTTRRPASISGVSRRSTVWDRDAPPWTPRGDDWILPLVVENQS